MVKKIFNGFVCVLKFIKSYFKSLIFLLILFLIFMPKPEPNLVEISLNGAIFSDKEILEKIYSARDNKNIKAVLLNINSPGGALSPSFEISMAVKSLAKIKPVVVYASGTMASGSYLSGVWANKIYANPGSFIGSIGVIIEGVSIEDLIKKIGVSPQVIKAGEYKEAGTFLRPWSEAEKEELQNLVNKSYALFTNEVAKARRLDLNKTNEWANARVFLANDAKKLGLIDKVSNYEDAKNETKKLAKVTNEIWEQSDDKSFFSNFSKSSAKILINTLLSQFNVTK